jgi:predicted phosphohydrolase
MRLVFISDTHTHRNISLPNGDVLVHAGDATSSGTMHEVIQFLEWFSAQPHAHKIFIAGNHDWLFEREPNLAAMLLSEHPDLVYLQDSGVEIEGTRFWGSPWQPAFYDWAFNLPRKGVRLREAWNKIPMGTDVLITHGPPYGALDQVGGGEHLGCEELKIRRAAVKPRVHVFGHIHDSYGVAYAGSRVLVNASICDEEYRPLHRPIVVDISPEKIEVLGTETRPQRERLTSLMAGLESAERAHGEIQAMQVQGIMLWMAEYLGKSPDELAQDYMRRGLRSDLIRFLRSEGKPSRRPLPVKILKGYEDDLDTTFGTE